MQNLIIILGAATGALIFYLGLRTGRPNSEDNDKPSGVKKLVTNIRKRHHDKGRVIVRTPEEEAAIEERLQKRPEEDSFERSKQA